MAKLGINGVSDRTGKVFKSFAITSGLTQAEALEFLIWRHLTNGSPQVQAGAVRRFIIKKEREGSREKPSDK